MKRNHVWLNSHDSWSLHKDDALFVYEKDSDCCRVSKVVLWADYFKIWNIEWYNYQ